MDLVPGGENLNHISLHKVDENPVVVYLSGLRSAGSRRVMEGALAKAARSMGGDDPFVFPWSQVRYQHVQALVSTLVDDYAPSTVNRILSAVKGVVRECWRLGQIDSETYMKTVDLKSVRGRREKRGRRLERDEQRALFAICRGDSCSLRGLRDQAILAVMLGGGLRRSEVVGVDITDVTPSRGDLLVRRGKGNRDRMVYLPPSAQEAVARWVDELDRSDGPLFVRILKGGNVTDNRLTPQAILYLLQRRADEAEIDKVSPHDLRRTFITTLLEGGADTFVVQRLAGHASSRTTEQYDLRGEEAKRKAAKLVDLPVAEEEGEG